MIQDFLSFIRQNKLWNSDDRLLLAVSGGADSMALLHLCWKTSLSFEVGHVNYGFRGEESDLDQQVVESYCESRGIPFHCYRIPLHERIHLKARNLQANAREVRYRWLQKIAQDRQLNYILTAHHAQDQVETFLWHGIRGTGIRGLGGIALCAGQLRRPLLFAQPETLAKWLTEEGIVWRTDSSNLTLDYSRNQIRHLILPEIQQFRSGALENLARASQEIQSILPFLTQSWEEFKRKNLTQWGCFYYFDSVEWIQNPTLSWMLSWWLKPLGFTQNQIENLRNATFSAEMKYFEAHSTLVIWVNSTSLWFTKSDQPFFQEKKELTFASPVPYISVAIFGHENTLALEVDASQLVWPLLLRFRRLGDRISIKNGKKKVSDVFMEAKVPKFLRDHWPILEDGEGHIRWIPGIWLDPSLLTKDSTQETVKFYAEPWRMS